MNKQVNNYSTIVVLLSFIKSVCFFFFLKELKAEVEKLRAAQMSSQGIEPERVRLFQQEISSLRNKLCQQEREMAEANRLVIFSFAQS